MKFASNERHVIPLPANRRRVNLLASSLGQQNAQDDLMALPLPIVQGNPSSPTSPEISDGVLEAIGNTPLIRLNRYLSDPDIELLVKLESANPGGSAKDRPARQMLEHAINAGEVNAETTVIESSSGNMGIGLAQACRYNGLRFICVVDPHAQSQNINIMRALGAEIECVTDEVDGSFLGARLARVEELLQSTRNSFWPNQYKNSRNPEAHERGTIREIDEQLGGDFDFLFVATSSTGTAQGCQRYLRQNKRAAKVVAVDACGSVLFGGTPGSRLIPGLGAGKVPALAKDQAFDHLHRVTDSDCVVGCRRAAATEAILVGGSAGGVLESVRAMSGLLIGKRCVAVLHDSGQRYLETVFNDAWVETAIGVSLEQIAERADIKVGGR